jgi:Melibiase/Glycosyl hydrolase family 36 C-terminal domain
MDPIRYLAIGTILFLTPGARAAEPADVKLSTADTAIIIRVIDAHPAITSLACKANGFDWVAGDSHAIPIPLIEKVQIGGHEAAIRWKFTSGAPGVLKFTCDEPALQLDSIWSAADGPGPVEHRLVITNHSKQTIELPVQPSLELKITAPISHDLEQWWVDKGAGTPTPDGTHRKVIVPGGENLLRCWPSGRDKPRDPIPWTSVQDVEGRQGWYAGVEYTARVQLGLKRDADDGALHVSIGLQSDDKLPYITRLSPGERFEASPVFIGCYSGDVDGGANRLRRWVRANLVPKAKDERYPLLVNNSWGSGMAVDELLSRKMIDESAELGLELFHIDAGWFRTVGDWRPNPAKFPNGLAPVADYAHSKGLKFGLWVGWTQGGDQVDPTGNHAIMSVRDPEMADWFYQRTFPKDWKAQDFTGATACLGEPKAVDWALATLRPLIKDAKLDLLEHDQTMVLDGCYHETHLHTKSRVDVGYRAAQGYYRVYDTLRNENPDLLFENCVNGGHMVDYGAVRRCHYISITDTYDPLSNRRAFYDASYALPPAMCECYIQNIAVRSLPHFKYMLRSGMMGWCTIMTDTSKWTSEQHDAAKRQFTLYKERFRPLIRAADLYHVSDRPDGVRWDGMQYFDPTTGRGVLFAFRGKTGDAEHAFPLKGLKPQTRYALAFEDGSSEPTTLSGDELMKRGLIVKLAEPESSELVFLVAQ